MGWEPKSADNGKEGKRGTDSVAEKEPGGRWTLLMSVTSGMLSASGHRWLVLIPGQEDGDEEEDLELIRKECVRFSFGKGEFESPVEYPAGSRGFISEGKPSLKV